MKYQHLIEQLNAPEKEKRLAALSDLMSAVKKGEMVLPQPGNDVNNHIHTSYSFSPYSPSKAIWMALQAGLKTAGIMDHDSISGAPEFIEAGKIAGLLTTIGVECRVKLDGTAMAGRRLNNPDQDGVAYVALHGVPHTQISTVVDYFRPFIEARRQRNRKMVEKINVLVKSYGIALDVDRDVEWLSMVHDGGTVTERHILFALAKLLIKTVGTGVPLVAFLRDNLKIQVSEKASAMLTEKPADTPAGSENPYIAYDLLGALKSDMVERFYIPALEECPDIHSWLAFTEKVNGISAYAYLGDVVDSVTGDKKAQQFEDSFLPELFQELKRLNFRAVTYMPSRNTPEQLNRVRDFCQEYALFQISGEDINSPRQKFICEAQRNPEFANLNDAAFALIGHEQEATEDTKRGFFSEPIVARWPDLDERIKRFKALAR